VSALSGEEKHVRKTFQRRRFQQRKRRTDDWGRRTDAHR